MRNNKWSNLLPYLALIAAALFLFGGNPTSNKNLSYDEFRDLLDSNTIKQSSVSVGSNVVDVNGVYTGTDGLDYGFSVRIPRTDSQIDHIMDTLEKTNVVDADSSNVFVDTLISCIPFMLLAGIAFFMMNKMNGGGNAKAFEFSKSRARLEGNIKVRFNDVAGCDEEKEEMAEIIDYLKQPKKFAKMGARIPKGILMVGSPGTGKTLLAKAVAGEADVPFYSISGSDFVEMFVGVGASRVRDMFKTAQKTAPCMVFIDEIDAVGRQRGAGVGGGNDEREQTLNQLLVEMDGISDNAGIVVIAATNRPDVLDPALLRPGRFDRQITVSLPDVRGRKAILEVHARNKKLADDINLEALAKRTPGFSGAELENVLNEAAILAVRGNLEKIGMEQLDEAIDRVMMGPAKKSRKYDEETKKLVAYHEAGHAVIGLKGDSPIVVEKVTIIPRGTAGGYNLLSPKQEKILDTKKDMIGSITSYLGGRAAEEIFFNDVTSGASNDIQEATRIARNMVTVFGMSDLGPIKYGRSEGSVFLGRDYTTNSNVSDQVNYEIDKEIRKIVDECYAKAREIINENKELLVQIATVLLEQETITAEEIQQIANGTFVMKSSDSENQEQAGSEQKHDDAEKQENE